MNLKKDGGNDVMSKEHVVYTPNHNALACPHI